MNGLRVASYTLRLELSEIPEPELVAAELEGFAFGLALCGHCCHETGFVRDIVSAIVGKNVDLDVVDEIIDLSVAIRGDLGLGRCMFPSHLGHPQTGSIDRSDLNLVGRTVLWMDGLIAAAKFCPKGWPRILFEFDRSEQFIEIFAFIEDETGQAVVDVDQQSIDFFRFSNLQSLPASLLRLYRACLDN